MKTFQEKTFALLESTGLNWSVRKDSLVSQGGYPTESFGIFRNDTNKWVGTVGHNYVPLQNSKLAEVMIQSTEHMDIHTYKGGSFKGGRKVFLQAKLPQEYIGNSGVDRYITALNSHDGSTCIGFGSTSVVVACQNKFYKAFKQLESFKHTIVAQESLETAIERFKQSMEMDRLIMDNFKRMSDSKMTEDAVKSIGNKLFPMQEESSSRRDNRMKAFADSLTTEVNTHGETVWALFNAVTRYTNHIVAPKDKKEEYITIGSGYNTNAMAFDECMQWIESKTASFHLIGI